MGAKRILFVDDETNVLQGIRDLLRKQRKLWDMVFALGAEAALAELAKAPFDVVVSDMRMPGMDGAELLSRVKDQYPGVTRIMLSGHAERQAIIRALPVAHQFLSKPCDGEVLRSTIERTCNLSSLLADPAIRQIVGSVDKLPSPPATYWELTQAAGNPDTGLSDLGKIVEKDPAMSAKVLQLVNSSYFGLAQRVTSVQHAVAYLGAEVLKGLALSAHVFGTVKMAPVEGFSLERIQSDSLRAARLAKRFVKDSKRGDEAFGAAIVHDIGCIILALGMPDRYAATLRAARETRRPAHVVEHEMLGLTHAQVGAYLLGIWGLPLQVVETAAFHHCPSRMKEGPFETLGAFHAADALIEADGADLTEDGLDLAFLERAGLASELPHWRALVAETR